MKHSSIPETAVSRSTLDGEVSSRDRISQCTVEQILDVPVHERVEHSAEMPKIVSQDEIQQRTVKQIADIPVPQAVEELAEVFKVYSRDEVHKRFVEQTIQTPSTSITEMIVEVPVIQTPSVQHVVDTVEVEKLKIIEQTVQKPVIQEKINQVLELTVQRKKPIIQEKINRETKHIELDKAGDMLVGVQRQMSMAQTVEETMKVQPLQFINKVVDVPVVAQRQIPIVVQTIQKTTDIPQLQCIDKVIDVPVVSVAQAPHVQIVEKTVESPQMHIAEKTAEIPLLQIVKKTVETPEVQTVRGSQTSESLGTAPFCQAAQAETVEAVEIEVPLPTESASSMFVTTPVMQRQTPMTQKVPKTVENPPVWFINRVVDVPVVVQRQVPLVLRVQKTVEVPQIQFSDKVVDAPVIMQPAPEMEHATPTLATEYIASATAVTTAGVNLDITGLMNPLLSITAGEASTPHVVDPSLRKRKSSGSLQSSAREGRHEN